MNKTVDFFHIRTHRVFGMALLVMVGYATMGMQTAGGATAVSRIFGAVPLVAQGESDTALSIPMKVPAVFRGAVGSVGSAITLAGAPNLGEDQFVYSEGIQPRTFYLFFESGSLAGRHFRITGNTSSTISVDDPNGELVGAAADDIVAVHPYWTLATLLSSDQGLPVAAKAGERPVEVIIPAADSDGTNLSAEAVYYERDGAWRRVGQPFASTYDDTILEPDRSIIVRLNGADDAPLVMTGEVVMSELAIPIRSRAEGAQDNLIGLNRPLDQSLDDLGLGGSNAFETTTDADAIRDRLILYSAAPGQNKVPTDAFYFFNGAWRREGGDPATDVGDTIIPAGQGFVIRTAGQGSDTVSVWTHTFNP
ncbi:MAG: TIGR02597 family protein [Opitutaceae bacterium]